jgi:PAS domain S-box-containing protein
MNPPAIDATASVVDRPSKPLGLTFQRYALAVLVVGVALGAALVLEHFRFRQAGVPLLLFACAISAWYGGEGPAAVAVVLSSMWFNYFFVEPIYSFRVAPSELPYFVVFASFAALLSWFSTIRRRVEADLRATRDRLQERSSLLDLTHDSIVVLDMDLIVTYWNRGAEEFYGWAQHETLGQRSDDLLRTVFPRALDEIRAELLETNRWEDEVTRTKADGSQAIAACRWSLRRDQQDRPVAILETSNDITGRRRREVEVQTLNRELATRSMALEASNKELEAFAYSISHDLRAPLRHMAGFAELLRKSAASALNEKSARYVTMILEAANRMGNLIDDLLAFSRIGRAEAHNSFVSLEQLVQEAVSEARQDASERKIVWKIDPLPICHGDRSMLRLALVNLISNAVKFTSTRSCAEIEIGCAERKDDQVVLFVRDNGVGFDMKYSNKLFGVFQRLHAQKAFEGTGIGLATVQRIVHRHGGRVWAEATVDRGATFYFSLSTTTGS